MEASISVIGLSFHSLRCLKHGLKPEDDSGEQVLIRCVRGSYDTQMILIGDVETVSNHRLGSCSFYAGCAS